MSDMKTVQKIQNEKIFNENLILQWQTEKMAKFCKMAKCVFSSQRSPKMAKFFDIGHEMANLATLEMSTDQDWMGLDQDWSQFWPDQDWIGLRKFLFRCDYSEHTKNFSCDPILQIF